MNVKKLLDILNNIRQDETAVDDIDCSSVVLLDERTDVPYGTISDVKWVRNGKDLAIVFESCTDEELLNDAKHEIEQLRKQIK